MNWTNYFIEDFSAEVQKNGIAFSDIFKKLTPVREQQFKSENLSVRGFVDAIHHYGDEVHIIDYKTNSKFDMKYSIKLQLAIYSLLYFEKYGFIPHQVGIFFLRHKLKMMPADKSLISLAKREIRSIHEHTSSKENVGDYPKTITGLCKWSTGQCDFYETCRPHD